jgi:hypothetical protein
VPEGMYLLSPFQGTVDWVAKIWQYCCLPLMTLASWGSPWFPLTFKHRQYLWFHIPGMELSCPHLWSSRNVSPLVLLETLAIWARGHLSGKSPQYFHQPRI